MSSDDPNVEKSVYERGGPELSDALVKPDNSIITDKNGLLAKLQERFEAHGIQIIAADAAITQTKSVNIELYLQTKDGKVPEQQRIKDILNNLGLKREEQCTFLEATLITDKGDLLCLKLVFQGDDAMQMARDKMPELAQLETKMKSMLKDSNNILRVIAQRSFGLFSTKKTMPSSGNDSPSNDSMPRGPGTR